MPSRHSEAYLQLLPVDPKLITEPLNDEQLKESVQWKIDYLQRLRREKVDESYINAYLKAWNLHAEDVFRMPVSNNSAGTTS